jgi:branched-chain amino acid aminotransferase
MIYKVESYYPEKSVYDHGVKTITVNQKRKIPEIKIENKDYKKDIKRILYEKKAFEAILKTNENKLLEGSRSNLFFVKGKSLYTAKDKDVLGGITKRKIIELISNNGIKLVKKDIYLKELSDFDGAFLTGTSIDILPIAQIDDTNFESSSNQLIKKLMEKYRELKQKNIKEC